MLIAYLPNLEKDPVKDEEDIQKQVEEKERVAKQEKMRLLYISALESENEELKRSKMNLEEKVYQQDQIIKILEEKLFNNNKSKIGSNLSVKTIQVR